MDKADGHPPFSQTGFTGLSRTISPALQGELGEQLRAMYRVLEAAPLPERMIDLLKQLDQTRSGNEV
jgi:hypothetical protein